LENIVRWSPSYRISGAMNSILVKTFAVYVMLGW